MRLGMIVRCDNSGLGTMSWEWARHLRPKKVHLVYNGVYAIFENRYQDFEKTKDFSELLNDIDVLISFETFYHWGIVLEARKKGVKTVLVTMFEMSPPQFPYMPDVLLCPSKLDYDIFKSYSAKKVQYLPAPIATDRLKWKQRKKAKVFIHPASHGGVNGRKGTGLLLDAMKFVKSDIKVLIYGWKLYWSDDPRVVSQMRNFENYWQVYKEGDVLIYPQDYNGISLPVVEAMASGMGVISTNMYPFNEYLPKRLLYEPESMYRTRAAPNLMEISAAKLNPKTIAAKIDEIANTDISEESRYGKEWANKNSWSKLLPKYKEFLASI